MSTHDDDDLLPIKVDSTSNGEYFPREPTPQLQQAIRDAQDAITNNARRIGMTRREYIASACGAATTLLALNQLGCGGGAYKAKQSAAFDPVAAQAQLGGKEFIFDVQTHMVSAERVWWKDGTPSLADFLSQIPQAKCGGSPWAKCFTDDVLIREVFMNSDTQMGVISGLWGDPLPMLTDEAARARDRAAQLGKDRVRIHGVVQPTAGEWKKVADDMARQVDSFKPSAFKLYTVWGPQGKGWWLTDPIGRQTIQHGLDLGVSTFAVHKGIPLPGMIAEYTRPTDVGPIAKAFPQATFLVYHSGWEGDIVEGPYNPKAERGVDSLIRSLEENGNPTNVYAELGSTWRELMKTPDQAAHVLGKLLKHLGEDRILWGTDAIWFGSPQDQIIAFRAFEISAEYQEKYGYPALTPERKAKIFGLNAARVYNIDVDTIRQAQQRDDLQRAREEVAVAPTFHTYGPKTRRDMLRLLDFTRGRP